jgi:hypothetical protein
MVKEQASSYLLNSINPITASYPSLMLTHPPSLLLASLALQQVTQVISLTLSTLASTNLSQWEAHVYQILVAVSAGSLIAL